jgi:hypothetical protein
MDAVDVALLHNLVVKPTIDRDRMFAPTDTYDLKTFLYPGQILKHDCIKHAPVVSQRVPAFSRHICHAAIPRFFPRCDVRYASLRR